MNVEAGYEKAYGMVFNHPLYHRCILRVVRRLLVAALTNPPHNEGNTPVSLKSCLIKAECG